MSGQVPSPAPSSLEPLEAEVVILTRDGRVPTDVAPSDVSITLDGIPRRITWVRRLSRGPGASADAARRAVTKGSHMMFAAEAQRTVVVAVDVRGLAGRSDARATQAAAVFLDRLGLGDRVAVAGVPFDGAPAIVPSQDPPAARDALERLSGGGGSMAARSQADVLSSLTALVTALGDTPGRKFVALFSTAPATTFEPEALDAFGLASAQARVTVATVAFQPRQDGRDASRQTVGFEQIAKAAGGSSTTLGDKASSRDLGQLVTELSAAFVVGFERLPTDDPGQGHALRVDLSRRDLAVRGPSRWFVRDASFDEVADPVSDDAGTPGPDDVRADAGAAAPETMTPDTALAIDRLADYVDAYERLASGLVAEEAYRQSTPDKEVSLRSDVLMVKPPGANEWVSFRDVYAVDKVAVRERSDRLHRLFLDPEPEARARLQAIKDESARYNIGPFVRDINVPYLALKFVRTANLSRLRLSVRGDREHEGEPVTRIEFDEVARPTIIANRAGDNVPATGWFLVESLTGAVVESGLTVHAPDYDVRIVVRYNRDPRLGMWVPERMDETYQVRRRSLPITTAPLLATVLRSTATYANFRRFKVETGERLADPPR